MICRAGASARRHPGITPEISTGHGRACEPPDQAHLCSLHTASPLMTVPIGHDRRNDDSAFHDVLEVRIQSDEREAARHDAENDCSNHCTGDSPDASRKARAADDGGGDRVELVRHAHSGLAARGARRRHHAAEPRQQSREGIDDDEMPLDPHAGHARRQRIRADGVRVFSVSRMAEQDVKDDGDDQKDRDGHGACSQARVAVRQHADRLPSRVVAREAACAHHHTERRDERRNAGVGNEAAVDEAGERSGRKARGDRAR